MLIMIFIINNFSYANNGAAGNRSARKVEHQNVANLECKKDPPLVFGRSQGDPPLVFGRSQGDPPLVFGRSQGDPPLVFG